MRVVAVSMVKNEADIVEAFVRHAATFADHHLIFDHASTDGTPFLLRRLRREGVPLTLFADDRVEVWQARRTTELMRRAVEDFAADWVLPLDADEFPQAPGGATGFRAMLAERLPAGRVLQYPLTNFAPHPNDSAEEANPVLRLRHRLSTPPDTVKVMVPRAVAADPASTLGEGNHLAAVAGRPLSAEDCPAWLAHFPTRSPAQTLVKAVQWDLQRRAGGCAAEMVGQHRDLLARIEANPRDTLRDPYFYLRGATLAPAEYWGDPVRYTPPLAGWDWAAACLLPFAKRLADSHGELVRANRPGRFSRWWNRLRRPRSDRMAFTEGLAVPDSRSSDRLAAELRVFACDGRSAEVVVRNTGLCVWRHSTADGVGVVHVGVQPVRADGAILDPDFHRVALPSDVDPGEEITLVFSLPALPLSASAIRFDVVSEGVRWFGVSTEPFPVPLRQVA